MPLWSMAWKFTRVRIWLHAFWIVGSSAAPTPVRFIALVAFGFWPPWHEAHAWPAPTAAENDVCAFALNDARSLQPDAAVPLPEPLPVSDWYGFTTLKWSESGSASEKLANAAVPPSMTVVVLGIAFS